MGNATSDWEDKLERWLRLFLDRLARVNWGNLRHALDPSAADRSSSDCKSAYVTLAFFFARCPP